MNFCGIKEIEVDKYDRYVHRIQNVNYKKTWGTEACRNKMYFTSIGLHGKLKMCKLPKQLN